MGSILVVVDCGQEGASDLSSLQARIHMLYLLVFLEKGKPLSKVSHFCSCNASEHFLRC